MGGGNSVPRVQYTREVPDSKQPGSSAIYRHLGAKPDLLSELPNKCSTLHENFVISAEKFSSCPFLGTRQTLEDNKLGEYAWKVYGEIREFSKSIGFGLHHLGVTELDEDGHCFMGIYSKNREEWLVTDFACMSQSITSVPLYDVQQAESINMVVEQTGMKAIATTAKLAENLLKLKSEGMIQTIKIIMVYENDVEHLKEKASHHGIRVFSMHEVAHIVTHGGVENPPTPESWYTVCYTSGTTGKSKGAIITHRNMVYMLAGALETSLLVFYTDCHISYLPLAHMLERAVTQLFTAVGGRIGFFGGDVMKLKEDLAELKPTVFVSVPRLYGRFYDAIKQQFHAATGLKKSLISKALKAKEEAYREKGTITHGFWDAVVFKKVRLVLGGNVRLMLTGSAPISGEVLSFLKLVFSAPLVEGYGQTETCAGSCLTHTDEVESGIIGGPLSTVEFKLVDVPDMEYLTTDLDDKGRLTPRGEICMRGPTVFQGYYKSPELTAEALDMDGWIHTGDVGMVLPHNGAFKIIDRKKNFFKLAQGEYVSADKLEIVYTKSSFIAQIYVYGDAFQATLIAIVVPDELYVRKHWAHHHGHSEHTSIAELCADPKLKEAILEDMNKLGKAEKLLGYEFVKKIHLEPVMWTPEDILTPTQKLVRYLAKKRYLNVIEELYSSS